MIFVGREKACNCQTQEKQQAFMHIDDYHHKLFIVKHHLCNRF